MPRIIRISTAAETAASGRFNRRFRARATACLKIIVFSILAIAEPAFALEPTTPLASYGRQTWVMENGLPQNTVKALAQTRNGFLWLGTEVGLVRFDGNNFVLFDQNSKPALPGNDVQCLLATDDGALWIGTGDGLARLQNGSVRTFTVVNGLPSNSILSLWEGPKGLDVKTQAGTVEIEDALVTPLQVDRKDGPSELFRAELADGTIVSVHATGFTILEKDRPQQVFIVGKDLPGTRIQTAFADRQGTLWIGTNDGLVRFTAGKVDRLPITDPLATASILSILEDHEGNLWIGTETSGLHILRDDRFRTRGTRDGLSSDGTTTVVEDAAGTLWVGTAGSGLNAISRSTGVTKVKSYSVRDGLTSDIILSLAAAPDGDLWVGTPDGLNRIHNGAINSYTTADGLPDDFVRSLLVDKDGSVWIGTRRGLAHAVFGSSTPHIDTFTQATGLGSDLVGAMARDGHGDLWVATLAGLSRLTGGDHPVIINYTAANGLSSNVITALLARSNGTLVVGTQDHGWNTWDGNHFSPVTGSGLDRTTIHAILDDEHGHLWFATGNGIARCDCEMSGGCSNWMEFGPADGLRGREMATNSHPSAWRSRDGRLWFATPKGLVETDPSHFPVNTVAPPVALVRFAADDVDQPLNAASLKVPAGHNHFQFDYAGLSFTAPQKVRYRYMLEGFDHQWTDAGARRSAYYTNIPPGEYTFRVQACNNDGVWNMAGTSLAFTLQPHFYQTIWFYILLLLFAAGLIALLLRMRLVRAEREFRAVLAERNRIAREVHDTLAQGYVGVSVQLEVLTELLRHNKTEAAISHLDVTRKTVREGLAEARQSIWALRSQDSGENTLPVKLRRATEHAHGRDLDAAFSIFGAYRSMPPGMEREILRVGQEAIHNVKKHAGAKHLKVQLEYGPAEVALVVRDDGRGFSTEDGADSPPGHYGLMGMRERAAAIGGTLEVTSELGQGTTVRLHVTIPKEASERTGD